MTDEVQTNLDRLSREAGGIDDEPFALCCDPLAERRGRKSLNADPESRRYNQALHRLVRGKYDIGGVCHELSVITGLSPEAIRSRVNEVEYDAPPEPLEPGTGMTGDDLKYFNARYGRIDNPEVREFLQKLNGGQRKDPDHEDRRVARQRIRRADGTTKLISIAIDPSRN